ELRRQQIVASRASYFAGWACYYWGVLPTPRTTEPLQQARSVFRRVLDIGQDESYAELDADSLELGSSWRARAMIGLGLCEAALSNIAACHECFRLVESEATPREIRDEAEFW